MEKNMIMWLFLLVTCHMMTTSFGNDNNAAGIEVMSESAENSFNLTVIVLTMNRPKSLQRLLESIKATDFEFDDDKFDVEIHIDKTVGGLYEQTISIAESFEMPVGHRGTVKVKKHDKNKGLRAAWFEAWYPKPDNQYCVIIEDDLEVSPFWFTWLRKAWKAYGERTDIAGIALQRQSQMYMKLEDNYDPATVRDVLIQNGDEPFLYKLVGTWGFAPHPKRWRELLDWFNSIDHDNFDPYVPGMATSDWLHMHTAMGKRHMTWEQWHIYHSEKHGLYTLYLNIPGPQMPSLLSNWREAGVHARGSANAKDYPTLDYCAIQLEYFPKHLKRYDWDAWDETIPKSDRVFSAAS